MRLSIYISYITLLFAHHLTLSELSEHVAEQLTHSSHSYLHSLQLDLGLLQHKENKLTGCWHKQKWSLSNSNVCRDFHLESRAGESSRTTSFIWTNPWSVWTWSWRERLRNHSLPTASDYQISQEDGPFLT